MTPERVHATNCKNPDGLHDACGGSETMSSDKPASGEPQTDRCPICDSESRDKLGLKCTELATKFNMKHEWHDGAPSGNAQESQAAAEAHAACPCRSKPFSACRREAYCKCCQKAGATTLACIWPGHHAIGIALLAARLDQAEWALTQALTGDPYCVNTLHAKAVELRALWRQTTGGGK